ncbi:MAG: hypothetical protein O3B01_07315 [Planctomycetota bacterium]|nr:hypothetical protein [Planctomycetota bacterium]
MFDQMTDRACICIEHARQEAERHKNSEVRVTHLLLGMLKETCGLACSILRVARIDLDALRDRIAQCLPDPRETNGRAEISEALKAVLKSAQEEAALMGQSYIGTEHLLLGILRNSESKPATMLCELGLNLDLARKSILALREDNHIATASEELPPSTETTPFPKRDINESRPGHWSDCSMESTLLPPFFWQHATERARKCLRNAHDSAAGMNHQIIEPVHLFLGLLKDESGMACSVLKKLGLVFEEARTELSNSLPMGESVDKKTITFSEESIEVLEHAAQEARSMEHEYLGTEHLVLGIMTSEESVTQNIVRACGFDYEMVRHEVLKILGLDIDTLFPEEDDFDPEMPGVEDHLPPVSGSSSPFDDPAETVSRGAKVKTIYDEEAAGFLHRIQNLEELKQAAICEEKFELAGHLRDQIFDLTRQVEESIKGSHTITYTYDEETLEAIWDLFDQYASFQQEGRDRHEILEWLKAQFFKLPNFAIPQRPKRRKEKEDG